MKLDTSTVLKYVTLTIAVSRDEIEERKNDEGKVISWTRRSLPDGTLTGDITLRVEMDDIIRTLGSRALRSKGKRASAFGGMLKAFATNLKREGGK